MMFGDFFFIPGKEQKNGCYRFTFITDNGDGLFLWIAKSKNKEL